jgi:glycosyltransferase involved in cell wall biosynthesis
MPVTQLSDLAPQVSQNSPKRIWVINPFDQLPNETDVPLRYWALCRTFAQQGHEVIWWSSNFSHLTKSKRPLCPDTDGFSVRLIETPPYTKNISFARLKNHKAFANGFYTEAMAGLKSGELQAPDRIVVSLPPLGVAEQAFRIRDYVRECKCAKVGTYVPSGATRPGAKRTGPGQDPKAARVEPSHLNTFAPSHSSKAGSLSNLHSHSTTTSRCEVVVDVMDAWPETFYQALPKALRRILGPLLLAPMHRSAMRAYQGADKISAVGQSYLNLAEKYLATSERSDTQPMGEAKRHKKAQKGAHEQKTTTTAHSSLSTSHSSTAKPIMLCYHGTELSRFQRERSEGETVSSESAQRTEDRRTAPPSYDGGHNKEHPTPHTPLPTSHSSLQGKPLRAVYLGAMGQGYDLMTIIEVAARWKAEGQFPFQIHFAGDGPQREALEAKATQLSLTSQPSHLKTFPPSHDSSSIDIPRVVFHGHLAKTPITELLESSHLALVPNRPDSLVACPYKAGEYAAAGLPMISCLNGELGKLLKQWDAGSEYNEGDAASLQAAFEKYSTDPNLLKQQSLNARNMAEALFDREKTYAELAAFILANDSADTQ